MSTEKPHRYKEHDFVRVENQVTPSAFRAIKWTVSDVDEKPTLARTFDQSFVTVRPKDKKLLGSSGAVWASEQRRLVEEFPTVFCLPTSLQPSLSTFLHKKQNIIECMQIFPPGRPTATCGWWKGGGGERTLNSRAGVSNMTQEPIAFSTPCSAAILLT